jgi:DDE superfamily endonuclease
MEDVLDLYEEPPDPKRPKVCFDELPYQIVAETRMPVPAQPGRPARVDYEYRRNGTANLFMSFDPDRGWRHVSVTDRRTKRDFAHEIQTLVDACYPDADVIRLVTDNLNTHTTAALYETFPPEEARRIAKKLEFHYTPKHGSWLDMAEIELSVLSGQCLDRRMGDRPTLEREVAAWEAERNDAHATVEWRFTSAAARSKLHRVYPVVS